jgi:esterase/lipase superfamily enzyme
MSEIAKISTGWRSERLHTRVEVRRWGHFGRPLLLFPTAGGDAEECERFLMVRALAPLLEAGQLKLYTCDSVAGRAWLDPDLPGAMKAKVQSRFDGFVAHELAPAIHQDCGGPLPIGVAGASIGAFNALAALCRHPELFDTAFCLSGTYDLSRWMGGQGGFDYHVSSPLHFVPGLDEGSEQLRLLRQRMVVLGSGEGRWEAPWECWAVARVLGARGIPNRVDLWGPEWDHDWVTWRHFLPRYLARWCGDGGSLLDA